MNRFLASMTRRLRVVWAWAFTGWIAPAVLGVALGLVLVGWLVPWGWFEPTAIAVVAGALVAVVLVAAFRPLSKIRAARAADRGLHTNDAFGAAVEFADLDSPFGEGIRTRADELALTSSSKAAAPLPRLRGRWAVAAAIGAAALVMGLVTNPQDEVRAERARANEIAEELATELDEQSEELDDPASAELAAKLADLAEELRSAQSFEEIEALLSEAEQDLSERSPDFAAERAAAEGLERSLDNEPLAGERTEGSASEQLAAAAAAIPDLNEQEREALANRLEEIADSLEAGDPETAEKAIAALGQSHGEEGDTVEGAAAKTGLDQGTLSSIVDQIGGEGSLGQYADTLKDNPAASGILGMLDRDGDGNPLNDIANMAGKFFGKK